MRRSPIATAATCLVALLIGGCAAPGAGGAQLLLYGEQHDQPDHRRQVADDLRALAAQGRLAALVLEMAERGRSTAGLPADADAAQVRAALAWDDRGWPWADYGPVVMAAQSAGVPVWGGNLPRSELRAAMADATLDDRVGAPVHQRIERAVRDGHCALLPEAQLPGMVRVQIARDRSIAQALRDALAAAPAGQRVMLLAGSQHVARDVGVPLHLQAAGIDAHRVRTIAFGSGAPDSAFDEQRPAAVTPQPDRCAELARQLQARPRP